MDSQLKLRFSEDVLSYINKGYKYVGVEFNGHYCCECYIFDKCSHPHHMFKWISYDEFVKESHYVLFRYMRYIPLDAFAYMFKDGDYKQVFWMLFHIRNLKHNIRNIVPQTASI